MTDPVRIAVVGAGLIGYQHILRVRGEPEAVLAAIVDPTVKAQELARDLGTRWFPDLHAMLEAITPDGVIVATPNQLHVANGLTCVAAGIPMLMEKPVSDDVATGWELVAATEQAGRAHAGRPSSASQPADPAGQGEHRIRRRSAG